MDKTRTQKSAKNTIFSFAVRFVTVLSNFLVKTVIVKQLGVEYSGLSTLFVDVLAILSLTELGFGTATGYALYKPLYEKDEDRIQSLMSYYKKIYRYIFFAIIGVGLACTPFIHHIVKNVPDIKESIAFIFVLYVFQTAASYSFVYKATLLDANQEKSTVSTVTFLSTAIFAVIEILILTLSGSYIFYLITLIAYQFTTNIAISFVANRKFPFLKEKNRTPLSKEDKAEIKHNVGALAIYKICGVMQKSVDSIVLSMALGTASVGYLANYRLIATHVDGIFGQIVESTRSSVGNLAVSESNEHQYNIYCRMNMLSFLIGNFITVSLFVLLNPFVTVWLGEKYLMGIEISIAVSADVYILAMARTYENFRIANSLFIEGKYRPVYMTIINIVLSVLFCKFWGVFGVLFATIIARVTTHVWYDPWLINRRVFKKSYFKYILVKASAALFVAVNCLVTYLIAGFIHTGNGWGDLILKGFLALTIPNLTALAAFGKTNEFQYLISSVLKIIKKKVR